MTLTDFDFVTNVRTPKPHRTETRVKVQSEPMYALLTS